MLKILRERYKIDIDCLDKESATPLFYAARQGNLELIKYLDSQGANLEHKEFQDRTPVYV
jgi:ankyrin repeat protein